MRMKEQCLDQIESLNSKAAAYTLVCILDTLVDHNNIDYGITLSMLLLCAFQLATRAG